jgi:hypothetical protein
MRLLSALAFSLSLVIVTPCAVSAATVDQIVALTKAGVSEPIILALIERDKTVFTIEPEQLVKLKQDGVSEAVILAMLKSGRAEGDEQARADAEQRAAMILSSLSAVPEVVLLGHGPDTPNVRGHFYSSYAPADIFAVPYGVPYAVPFSSDYAPRRRARRHVEPVHTPTHASPALCMAHVATGPVPPMIGSKGFVTVCPEPMQRALRHR